MKAEQQEQQLSEFRRNLENIINTDQTLLHSADIKRIREDSNFCRRFLVANKGDVEKAVSMAQTALEWRKSFGINDSTESTLKVFEFLKSCSLYPYGLTRTGAHILVMKAKRHTKPKNPEEALQHKKLFAFMLERMINDVNVERVCLMMDCEGAGYDNVDIEGVKFMISAFRDYYPAILEQILVVEIPWVLQAVWKVIRGLLPGDAQRIIYLVGKKQLVQYVDADNLPKWLNGKNDYCYSYVPGKPLGEFCPDVQQSSYANDQKLRVTPKQQAKSSTTAEDNSV